LPKNLETKRIGRLLKSIGGYPEMTNLTPSERFWITSRLQAELCLLVFDESMGVLSDKDLKRLAILRGLSNKMGEASHADSN
jgi:hypothetical protein